MATDAGYQGPYEEVRGGWRDCSDLQHVRGAHVAQSVHQQIQASALDPALRVHHQRHARRRTAPVPPGVVQGVHRLREAGRVPSGGHVPHEVRPQQLRTPRGKRGEPRGVSAFRGERGRHMA
eukprot:1181932-Prorocentrum_minimum.AAC.1